jgi:hypothetical protein
MVIGYPTSARPKIARPVGKQRATRYTYKKVGNKKILSRCKSAWSYYPKASYPATGMVELGEWAVLDFLGIHMVTIYRDLHSLFRLG